MKKYIIYIIIIVLTSSVGAEQYYNNFLTRSIADNIYCQLDGVCNVTGTGIFHNVSLSPNCVDGQILKWSGGVGQCGNDLYGGGGSNLSFVTPQLYNQSTANGLSVYFNTSWADDRYVNAGGGGINTTFASPWFYNVSTANGLIVYFNETTANQSYASISKLQTINLTQRADNRTINASLTSLNNTLDVVISTEYTDNATQWLQINNLNLSLVQQIGRLTLVNATQRADNSTQAAKITGLNNSIVQQTGRITFVNLTEIADNDTQAAYLTWLNESEIGNCSVVGSCPVAYQDNAANFSIVNTSEIEVNHSITLLGNHRLKINASEAMDTDMSFIFPSTNPGLVTGTQVISWTEPVDGIYQLSFGTVQAPLTDFEFVNVEGDDGQQATADKDGDTLTVIGDGQDIYTDAKPATDTIEIHLNTSSFKNFSGNVTMPYNYTGNLAGNGRQFNSVYFNNNSMPLFVELDIYMAGTYASGSQVNYTMEWSNSNFTIEYIRWQGTTGKGSFVDDGYYLMRSSSSFIVPPFKYYRVRPFDPGAGIITLKYWYESQLGVIR